MEQNKIQEVEPKQLFIFLKHYQQKFSWDCGISCILMILSDQQKTHLLDNFNDVCKEEGFNKSTWTIDLCYLLKRYDIKHEFFTTTLGIHPGYKEHAFYNKALTKDETRVNERFKIAKENGLYLSELSLDITDLLNHLKIGPIILLTNARLLNCDFCKLNKISTEFRKCIPWPVSYQGHYIVLCGYDCNFGKVYYRNPTFNDRVCRMSIDILEESRKSYGTDEDAILIVNKAN